LTELAKITKISPAFEDQRGSISDIILGQTIKHVGIITSKANSLRGSHYHKSSIQYNYVISGKLELKLKKSGQETAKIEKIILEPGDLVEIQPYVIHALTAIEDSEFFVFTSEFRIDKDYENDTFRVDI